MNQDTSDFIETWLSKISDIQGSGLDALFNRYTSYYTLYNRLYNESFKQLKESKSLTKARYGDFEKATDLVVQFNSAEDIIKALTNNGNIADIELIANLIKNEIFNINLAEGIPQRHNDVELVTNLLSEDTHLKARAVMSTIYNVRSNMLHGEKHYEQYQELLLQPLLNILKTIVNLPMEKLR